MYSAPGAYTAKGLEDFQMSGQISSVVPTLANLLSVVSLSPYTAPTCMFSLFLYVLTAVSKMVSSADMLYFRGYDVFLLFNPVISTNMCGENAVTSYRQLQNVCQIQDCRYADPRTQYVLIMHIYTNNHAFSYHGDGSYPIRSKILECCSSSKMLCSVQWSLHSANMTYNTGT